MDYQEVAKEIEQLAHELSAVDNNDDAKTCLDDIKNAVTAALARLKMRSCKS